MSLRTLCLTCCTLFAAACAAHESPEIRAADSARADSIARVRQDSINRAQPGYIIDSILPLDEEVRRFRAAIGAGDSLTVLQHASDSREALVRRFVKAVTKADTADLLAMVLSPREFIDLVYFSSPYAGPPYHESPGRVWMLISHPSETGLTRVLRRLGGRRLDYIDHACDALPDRQGANRLWTKCVLHVRDADGSVSTHRYFGTILERDGRFKFVSYTNEF